MSKMPWRFLLLIVVVSTLSMMVVFHLIKVEPKENMFQKLLVSKDVNNTIQLYRNPFTEYPFRFGKIIDLGIKNRSKEMVVFSWDQGVRLFMFKDGIWIKVVDNLDRRYIVKTGNNTYNARNILPTDLFHLPPKGDTFEGEISNGTRFVSASPVLAPSDTPITLRFMVVGTIYQNGQPTDKQVIAYRDIKIVR